MSRMYAFVIGERMNDEKRLTFKLPLRKIRPLPLTGATRCQGLEQKDVRLVRDD
jgi:hypothetical protein